MNTVLMLTVKGNLRHRIEKLGTEKDVSELTEAQLKLRKIAQLQNLGGHSLTKFPERPEWANGAFLYLTREHASEIIFALKDNNIELQGKYILVSTEYKPIVDEVLKAQPGGAGREAFLLRRAGVIEKEDRIPMPVFSHVESSEIRQSLGLLYEDDLSHKSECTRMTHSTGDRPHCDDDGNWKGKQVLLGIPGEEDLPPRDADYGPRRKNFHKLLQLSGSLMENREIDLDLLEYLTSPASVQALDPAMWADAWKQVSVENQWLEMRRSDPLSDPCIFCLACQRSAELSHLTSQKCRSMVRSSSYSTGPLLKAILEAYCLQKEEPEGHGDEPIATTGKSGLLVEENVALAWETVNEA